MTMTNDKDPFEEFSMMEDGASEVMEEETAKKTRAKRTVAKYYVVREVVYEAATARQVNDYLRDNHQEGMGIIKGFHSLPRRKESFEF